VDPDGTWRGAAFLIKVVMVATLEAAVDEIGARTPLLSWYLSS
jgi:hypothetical protein